MFSTSIRLPKDIEKIIRERALENDRSISNEMVHLIKKALKNEKNLADAD